MQLNLDRNSDEALYEQVYQQILNAIINREIASGYKLPSQRQMARTNGISINTVTNAYDQLVAEGYIKSIPRSGYFVVDLPELDRQFPEIKGSNNTPKQKENFRYDLTRSTPDPELFPFDTWRKIFQNLFKEEDAKILKTENFTGLPALKEAILNYIKEARGVSGQKDALILGPSTEYLMQVLIEILNLKAESNKTKKTKNIAVEDPGYNFPEAVLKNNKLNTIPIKVTQDGLDTSMLIESDCDLVFLTPNHQFPTGTVLSISTRSKLLIWARDNNVYLIEDDYDSEFRYEGMPIPSFYHLDQGQQVIYLSSLTRNLAPGIRLSYMLLPKALTPYLEEVSRNRTSPINTSLQWALYEFINSGSFTKHLNTSKRRYKLKREIMLEAIFKIDPSAKIKGEAAGLHIVLEPSFNFNEEFFLEGVKKRGLKINTLSRYSKLYDIRNTQQIFLSFSSLKDSEISEVVSVIYEVLEEARLS